MTPDDSVSDREIRKYQAGGQLTPHNHDYFRECRLTFHWNGTSWLKVTYHSEHRNLTMEVLTNLAHTFTSTTSVNGE